MYHFVVGAVVFNKALCFPSYIGVVVFKAKLKLSKFNLGNMVLNLHTYFNYSTYKNYIRLSNLLQI